MAIEIRKVENSRQKRDFLSLPFILSGNSTDWNPPVFSEERRKADFRRNQKHDRFEKAFFVAYDIDGKPVGRIALSYDRHLSELEQENHGSWWFFDCADDPEAADALFRTARRWFDARGVIRASGPLPPLDFPVGGFREADSARLPFPFPSATPGYGALAESAGLRRGSCSLVVRLDLGSSVSDTLKKLVQTVASYDPQMIRIPEEYTAHGSGRFLNFCRSIYSEALLSGPDREHQLRFLQRWMIHEYTCVATSNDRPLAFAAALSDAAPVALAARKSLSSLPVYRNLPGFARRIVETAWQSLSIYAWNTMRKPPAFLSRFRSKPSDSPAILFAGDEQPALSAFLDTLPIAPEETPAFSTAWVVFRGLDASKAESLSRDYGETGCALFREYYLETE